MTTFSPGARVVTPQGAGKVIRVSPKLKYSHLVQLDAGGISLAYRADELTAAPAQQSQGQTRVIQ